MENSLDLMSFDLGPAAGGEQMIIASKSTPDGDYVFTLGNPPQGMDDAPEQQPTANQNNAAKAGFGDQMRNLLNKLPLPGLNHGAANQAPVGDTKPDNIKLRCFNLTMTEDGRRAVKEYVTPEGISKVAGIVFGIGKDEPEATM